MSLEARAALAARGTKLRLVIYDCDGVLIDSEPIANRLIAHELTALGWKMTPEESNDLFLGISYPDMCPLIEHRLGRKLPETWLPNFLAGVIAAMAEEAEPVPGARHALESTTALGLEWRVASNSSHAEMAAKFTRAGFSSVVAGRIHSAQDVMAAGGQGKPAPDLFLAAAAAASIPPDACLVIEDSPAGIRAARAAGMTCLALVRHGPPDALAALGAAPFAAMHDLPDLLRHALETVP